MDDGSVFISDLSGLIPPEVRLFLYDEEKIIAQKGAARYILCGPVVDINNITQIAGGTCPNLTQLYTMNWDIQNTVKYHTILFYLSLIFQIIYSILFISNYLCFILIISLFVT